MRALFKTLVVALLLTVSFVHAQDSKAPSGPVRILTGFPAGGSIDVVARVLADKLKDDLGVPVVVEARPGAGGQLAAIALKQSAPDGRTLMLVPDHTAVIVPLTVKSPGYDTLQDFVPVAQVARYLGAFAVSSMIGVKNVSEFLAWAKANPGRANVGIPAPGSIPHFAMYALARETGAPLTTVPYKGSAPLVQDLLAEQVASGTTAMADFLEHHASGKLRIIAVVDQRRSDLLPDVPTFIEQGYKLEWEYWIATFAPAGTPRSIVERYNRAIAKAMSEPDVRERLRKMVFEPVVGSPEALGEKLRASTALWAPIIKASGWELQ